MTKNYIYILNLEDNKKYVGKTQNPNMRIDNHFKKNGSEWTKKYKPLSISAIFECSDIFSEDIVTIRCMKEYGINNIRGGSFSSINLEESDKKTIRKMIDTADNKCYECGKDGHFISDCKQYIKKHKKNKEIYDKVKKEENKEENKFDNYNKIEVIVKPTQSGKTSVIIDTIKNKKDKNIMDIVFADNNILLGNQTGKRIVDNGCNATVITCKNKDVKCETECLGMKFLRRDTLVLLSNKTRFDFVESFLNDEKFLSTINQNENIKFRIWIDEFDSRLNEFKEHIEKFSKNKNVIKILGLTATPQTIKNILLIDNIKYSFLPVDDTKYHYTKDHIYETIKIKGKNKIEDIFENILSKYNNNDGNIWFCPAEKDTQDHDDVKNFFLNKGYVCIIINGKEKRIYISEKKYVDITQYKNKELSEILSEWIKEYRKNSNKSIAITGNLCIERGITICSKEFMISHSIIIPQNNTTKLYQLAGRLNGNFKDFFGRHKHYEKNKPVLYCDKETKEQLLNCELIALGTLPF